MKKPISVNVTPVICPKCGLEQDPEHPQCIHLAGRKGGKRGAAKRDMRMIGRLGGLANLAKRGLGHYREIGAKGGEVIKQMAQKNPDYWKEIGRKGGAKTAELVRLGRAAKQTGEFNGESENGREEPT